MDPLYPKPVLWYPYRALKGALKATFKGTLQICHKEVPETLILSNHPSLRAASNKKGHPEVQRRRTVDDTNPAVP